jgi:hypothetical protein
VVEQFGMRWGFTANTEVIDAANKAFAEKLLPDSIDRNARCEWVALVREPVCELGASTLTVRNGRKRLPRRHPHGSARHQSVCWSIRVTTHINWHVGRVGPIAHGECLWPFVSEELGMLDVGSDLFELRVDFIPALCQSILVRRSLDWRSGGNFFLRIVR